MFLCEQRLCLRTELERRAPTALQAVEFDYGTGSGADSVPLGASFQRAEFDYGTAAHSGGDSGLGGNGGANQAGGGSAEQPAEAAAEGQSDEPPFKPPFPVPEELRGSLPRTERQHQVHHLAALGASCALSRTEPVCACHS